MHKILVSACLMGEPVRYHGGHSRLDHAIFERWRAEGRLVSYCPEVGGGLPTPRAAAELVVFSDGRRALTRDGDDVTDAFVRGAAEAVRLCAVHGIRIAILKDTSPSCGSRAIADGTFTGRRIPGEGITTSAVRGQGVQVFGEDDIDRAVEALERLERGA